MSRPSEVPGFTSDLLEPQGVQCLILQGGQCLRPKRGQGLPLIVLEPQGGQCLRSQRGQGLPLIVREPKSTSSSL